MPLIEIEGRILHYQIRGSGFPVLLGHSYLWDSSMWEPQIKALSRSFQVIAPDLWGHGRSGGLPENTRTLGDLAGHASRLLDALAVRQCAVVGLSVGGMWGAELALRDPARVRTLVMMDTDFGAEPHANRTRYIQMLDTIEALGSIPSSILDAVVPLFLRDGADPDAALPMAFRRALENFSASQLRQSIVPLGRLIFERPDSVSGLAALDGRRTLLMCGAQDVARTPAEMVRMAGIIGCRHVLIPEAGHISNLENPAFVTDILLRWLAQQTGTLYRSGLAAA
jgi:pimeloyl-ACP methyl ester carboxylesterase